MARMGDRRSVYRDLVGRPVEHTPFGRPNRRLENIIKIDLQDFGWGIMNWIDLAEDMDRWRALVDAVIYILVP